MCDGGCAWRTAGVVVRRRPAAPPPAPAHHAHITAVTTNHCVPRVHDMCHVRRWGSWVVAEFVFTTAPHLCCRQTTPRVRHRRQPRVAVLVCVCWFHSHTPPTHHPTNKKTVTTFSDGYLGSCIDEERSELRYVVRIADHASHRIFERTWRPGASPRGMSV